MARADGAAQQKTLIDIAHISRGVFDALVKHHSSRTVESFQLEKIVVASGAIVETLNKALLLERGDLDTRLLDWLASEEPKTCLDVLNRMDVLLRPSLQLHDRVVDNFFLPSRRFVPAANNKNSAAIKLFRRHEGHFYFLLSTEVWNHEDDIQQQLVAPLSDVLRIHGAGAKPDPKQVVQYERRELPGVPRTETRVAHTATQDRKTKKQGFDRNKVDRIVKWLSAWSCKDIHERTSLLRQKDTCTWLPNTKVYKTWMDAEISFLWLHGKPGAGKSILAASTIDNIQRSLQDDDVLAYFYCDFRTERSMNAAEVMKSLLSQLLQQCRHHIADPGDLIDELVKQKDERHSASAMKFACYISRLAKCLKRQPLLVLDALDECNDVEELLGALEELNNGNVRLFVTSRPWQVIKERFHDLPLINMDMMNYEMSADIRLHVTRELDSHRRLRILDACLKCEIHSVLCEKADSMFRWVQCQLNLIKRCVTAAQIQETLNGLPSSLDETYERILRKISEDEHQSKVARRSLEWLVVALAPLRLSQIMEGLSIDPVGNVVDLKSAPVHGPALLDVLGSLVSYSEVTDIVILSHFSVKEYLTAGLAHDRPSVYYVDKQAAHTQLALLCMCYIGIHLEQNQQPRGHKASPGNNHNTRERLDGSKMTVRSTIIPTSQLPPFKFHSLDEYALRWGFLHLGHINPRSRVPNVLRAIETFHSNVERHPSGWDQLCRGRHPFDQQLPTMEHDIMLYILIAFAPEPLLRSFLSHRKLKLKDGTNPLIYAAYFGKIEHARTLLSRGVELNRSGRHLRGPGQLLPLEVAVTQSADYDMINLFLAEGSHVPHELFVNVLKPNYSHLPAHIVARLVQTDQFTEWATDGQEEDLLLRALDVTRYYSLAYSERPSEQFFDIIKRRLVQLGCDPSAHLNETSLRHAVSAGHVSAVQQMLSLDIPFPSDIILDASRSTTPNAEMIRFCLDKGADVHVVSPTGNTALHVALTSPNYFFPQSMEDVVLENVRALIDAGCDASRCNLAGETPLHLAFSHGLYIPKVAEDLLPLYMPLPPDIFLAASESRKLSTIQLLIDKGANVHVIAANGDTPLHRVLCFSGSNSQDCLDCVKALLDVGCNPCIPNADGKTPFDIAAENDHLLVMQHLHDTLGLPVSPNVLLSVAGKLALRKASTIKFLIDNGASVHVTSPAGNTLLHLSTRAVFEPDALREIKIFVSAGCDPRVHNLSGETSFHVAARECYTSVMEYLLSLGTVPVPSDIMITQFEGGVSPRRRRHTIIRFLLDIGGDIHTVAENGDTLLHLAARLGPEEDALELAKHLVHAGCIPSALNSLQETPLHVAARSGFTSVIKYLLSLGIPLPHDILLAASSGLSNKAQLICYLIQEGASVSVSTTNLKDTPLHLLLFRGEEGDLLECVKILICAGCDPCAENLAGKTPLHSATRHGLNKIMEYLLSQGVPLPPDVLLSASTTATIHFLLNKGLDFCAVTPEDVTGLMHRVFDFYQEPDKSDVEVAKTLISAGWDPSLKNSLNGETAIHVATRRDNLDAVKFFLSQHVPLPSDILLSVAMSTCGYWGSSHSERVIPLTRFLIGEGMNVNVTAPNGDTPLHLTIMRGFSEVNSGAQLSWRLIEILLDSGADPSVRNDDEKTPFDLAEAKGHFFNENFRRLVRNSRLHASP